MAFKLTDLPYADSALDPAVSAETLSYHHGKHHQAYVDKLNDAVDGDDSLKGKSLEDMFRTMSKLPKAVRNNGGGHWNHALFWKLLAPEGQTGEPSGALKEAIDKDLGGMDKFKEAFNAAGAGQFGSGWAWLVKNGDKLEVRKTLNAENPITDGATPLLTMDVWEHAYYLDYQNSRPNYMDAFLESLVNWDFVNQNLADAGA